MVKMKNSKLSTLLLIESLLKKKKKDSKAGVFPEFYTFSKDDVNTGGNAIWKLRMK